MSVSVADILLYLWDYSNSEWIYFRTDRTYTVPPILGLELTPSEPWYFQFNWPITRNKPNITSVVLRVDSLAGRDFCMTLSIQPISVRKQLSSESSRSSTKSFRRSFLFRVCAMSPLSPNSVFSPAQVHHLWSGASPSNENASDQREERENGVWGREMGDRANSDCSGILRNKRLNFHVLHLSPLTLAKRVTWPNLT